MIPGVPPPSASRVRAGSQTVGVATQLRGAASSAAMRANSTAEQMPYKRYISLQAWSSSSFRTRATLLLASRQLKSFGAKGAQYDCSLDGRCQCLEVPGRMLSFPGGSDAVERGTRLRLDQLHDGLRPLAALYGT